jgi:hypothetical protein
VQDVAGVCPKRPDTGHPRPNTGQEPGQAMQISIIDEKYADLPPRVRQLEINMFTPKQR